MQQIPISDAYFSHLYSPYMMPISNYYTGSSQPSSGASTASSSSSPYQYTSYAHNQQQQQSASSILKPNLLSLKDRLLKAASSNRQNTTKTDNENEKLQKQLQVALVYQQLMALQQYRSLFGGSSNSFGGYGDYPGSMAALYQSYYQQPQAEASSDSLVSALLPTTSEDTSAAASNKSPVTSEKPTTEQLERALAATVAYRQQLALYAQKLGGGSGAGSYGVGGVSSLYGSGPGGFGYPSGIYSGAYGNAGGFGYGGNYGASSLYGAATPSTGTGGMLSSLTGGLSALTGGGNTGGLGLLSSLGLLFG